MIKEFDNCLECNFGLDVFMFSFKVVFEVNECGLGEGNLFGIEKINDEGGINRAVRVWDESYLGLLLGEGRGVGLSRQKGFLERGEVVQVEVRERESVVCVCVL